MLSLGLSSWRGRRRYSGYMEVVAVHGHHRRTMKSLTIAVIPLLLCAVVLAQLALKSYHHADAGYDAAIVKSINCLVESGGASTSASLRTAMCVLPRPVRERKWTRCRSSAAALPHLSGFMLAILSMPVDNNHKSAIVTPGFSAGRHPRRRWGRVQAQAELRSHARRRMQPGWWDGVRGLPSSFFDLFDHIKLNGTHVSLFDHHGEAPQFPSQLYGIRPEGESGLPYSIAEPDASEIERRDPVIYWCSGLFLSDRHLGGTFSEACSEACGGCF